MDLTIHHHKVQNFNLVRYLDSDWVRLCDDRKSTSGYVFNLGLGAVAWTSKKQEMTTLSSLHVKYILALCATTSNLDRKNYGRIEFYTIKPNDDLL